MAVDDSSSRRAGELTDVLPDAEVLRSQVRDKYLQVAVAPGERYPFHTGRPLAARLGYDQGVVDGLPDRAVASFAGVGNPFSLRQLVSGERVVDAGSGAGFDSFIAAGQVGRSGAVVGVDMTAEMLAKSGQTAADLEYSHVEYRDGLAEALPVADGWADVVISNGLIDVCGQAGRVRRDPSRVASGRVAAVRRHRQRPSRAGGGDARRRPVDRLNCRRAAPCGLADDA